MASSLITGGTGITVVTLVPPVEWILNGCPRPIPESVPYLIAAGILMCCHALFNYFNKNPSEPQSIQAENETIKSSAPIPGVSQNLGVPKEVPVVPVDVTVNPVAPTASRSNI